MDALKLGMGLQEHYHHRGMCGVMRSLLSPRVLSSEQDVVLWLRW